MSAAPEKRKTLWTEIKFWGGECFTSVVTVEATWLLAQWFGLADGSFKPIKNPHVPGYAFLLFVGFVLVLYFHKYFIRVSYGITEILFAIFGFALLISQSNFDIGPFTVGLAGSVYLAIRGLDNVVTGAKARYTQKFNREA